MNMFSYDEALQTIIWYYDEGSTIWNKVQTGEATWQEIARALDQIPQVQADKSISGQILGYGYAEPISSPSTVLDDVLNYDSNLGGSSYGGGSSLTANIPASFSDDGGRISITGGSIGGLGQTLSTIADRALLGVMGVNIGAKLGKAIDSAIYNLDPEWWDKNYPTINPETWVDIAGQNELGQSFIRTLFDIKSSGTTAYVDERILAQTYQLMRDLGVLSSGEKIVIDDEGLTVTLPINYSNPYYIGGGYTWQIPDGGWAKTIISDIPPIGATYWKVSDSRIVQVMVWNENPGPLKQGDVDAQGTIHNLTNRSLSQYTYDDKIVYYVSSDYPLTQLPFAVPESTNNNYLTGPVSWLICYGDYSEPSGIDGINTIPDATQYPPTNITGTDLDTVLQQLKQEYPDLFTDSITETVLQPDGSLKTQRYVPVPWVATDTDPKTSPLSQTKPTTQPYTSPQTHTTIDPSVAEQIITRTTGDTETPPPTTPPSTGDGDTPTSITPAGNASSLWSVYNPTQAQVDSFGSWLWSSNFIEQIKKLFADPMQAIIGIHKVFCTPETGESRNIVCGYIDSGVSSKIVTNQYKTIDCGSVSLREYFGSVMDYAPYTKVKIYLPFIGIVPLDVADIMRSTISVKYKVDVFTGACLAQVEVTRDNSGGTLYTYSGSAIVSYPLSSGSYAGIISGVLSAVSGIATSALTGGNPIPAIMGAGSAIMSSHTDVSHHGTFTGCAGAMGIKIPYLIITRPQVITPSDSGEYYGYSAPYITKIGICEGYIKCKETHINIPNATADENAEINNLLLSGIYIDSMYDGSEIIPPSTNIIPLNVSANGTYNKPENVDGYNPIYVNVPNSFTPNDENKVVSNGALVAQTPYPNTVTENGTYNTTLYNSITVNISGGSSDVNIIQFHSGKLKVDTGVITEDNDYCYSDLIPINSPLGYWFLDLSRSDLSSFYTGICFYDQNGVTQLGYIRQYQSYRIYQNTSGTGAKYFRIANKVSNLSFASVVYCAENIYVGNSNSIIYKGV